MKDLSSSKKTVILFVFICIIFNYAISGFGIELKTVLACLLNVFIAIFVYTGSLIVVENMDFFTKDANEMHIFKLVVLMGVLIIGVYLYLVLSTLKYEFSRETLKTIMVLAEQMVLIFILSKYRKEI